ncbi:STM4015 family protein [Plantactinospora sp. B6F1]|uniref:STM4015 family protein n=1 Tax=Plantactinospora sp. B6F1 TaxID=3158971 RepID=UPI0032D9A17E
MTIYAHITEFADLPVVDFDPARLPDVAPDAVAWRLSLTDFPTRDGDFADLVERFLAAVDPAKVTALIVGDWGEAYEESAPVELVAGLAPRLAGLKALFMGEMVSEQSEISWITQADPAPLLTAYPGLEILRIRGATQGLTLTPTRHTALRELAIEAGGLPGHVVRAIGECDLPALAHLELWLGTDQYGGDTTVEDLAPILGGERLPSLRSLGLRNAEIADRVAVAVAGAPVVARLRELDLSLGVLSDEGAAALLAGQPLTHLRRLDLHHHYLSAEMADRLVAELPGVELDLSDVQPSDQDDDRYIAVSE